MTVAYGMLQRAKESSCPGILWGLCGNRETARINRFISLLLEFLNGHKQWKIMFNVAATMHVYDFQEESLGASRLNVVVRLQYYSVSPLIILGDLFLNQYSKENVR